MYRQIDNIVLSVIQLSQKPMSSLNSSHSRVQGDPFHFPREVSKSWNVVKFLLPLAGHLQAHPLAPLTIPWRISDCAKGGNQIWLKHSESERTDEPTNSKWAKWMKRKSSTASSLVESRDEHHHRRMTTEQRRDGSIWMAGRPSHRGKELLGYHVFTFSWKVYICVLLGKFVCNLS